MTCIALDGNPVEIRASARLDELLLGPSFGDVFAGWGGASLGMEMATQRPVTWCMNHGVQAVQFHTINHPHAVHFRCDVRDMTPAEIVERVGRAPSVLWFSPDCRHFSPARGAAPVADVVRSLAWVVVDWANSEYAPDVFMVENVPAFTTWGPIEQAKNPDGSPRLDSQGRPWMVPIKGREGEEFNAWVKALRKAGYEVQWRVLNAADYGVPQHRHRLFVVGRRDGKPIRWPEKTHGEETKTATHSVRTPREVKPIHPSNHGSSARRYAEDTPGRRGRSQTQDRCSAGDRGQTQRLIPYRTAAECIDWDKPIPSIFGRTDKKGKPKWHAPKTLRRVAFGNLQYTLDSDKPYLIRCAHGGDHFRGQPITVPGPVVTGSHDTALCAASSVTIGYGEREGQEPRTRSLEDPATTIVGSGKAAVVGAHLVGTGGAEYAAKPRAIDTPAGTTLPQSRTALGAAHVAQFYGGMVGKPLDNPLPNITSKDHNALNAACIAPVGVKFRGDSAGWAIDGPSPVITSGAGAARPAGAAHALGLGAAFISPVGGPQRSPAPVDQPYHAVLTREDTGFVCASLIRMNHGEKQWHAVDVPLCVITSQGNKHVLTSATCIEMYGTGHASRPDAPTHAVTAGGNHHMLSSAYFTRYYSSGGQDSRADAPAPTIPARDSIAANRADLNAYPLTLADLIGAARVGRFMERWAGVTDPYATKPTSKKALREKMLLCARMAGRSRHGPPRAFRPSWLVVGRKAYAVAALKSMDAIETDLGLRMLTPRELARCQGFPDDYVLPKSKSVAVKLIGNSVPPPVVAALMRANCPEMCTGQPVRVVADAPRRESKKAKRKAVAV